MPENNSQAGKEQASERALSTAADGTLSEEVLSNLAKKASEMARAEMRELLEKERRQMQSAKDKEVARVRLEERARAQEAQEQEVAELMAQLRQSVQDSDTENALDKANLSYQQRQLERRRQEAEAQAKQQQDFQKQQEFIDKTYSELGLSAEDINPFDYESAEEFAIAASKLSLEKQKTMSESQIEAMINAKMEAVRAEAEQSVRKRYGLENVSAPEPTAEPGDKESQLRELQRAHGNKRISTAEYIKRSRELQA